MSPVMPSDSARLVPSEGTTVDRFAEIEQEFTDPEDPSLPNAQGVAWLIAEVHALQTECDQWQAKVADCWRENAALRESVAWNTEQRSIQAKEIERLTSAVGWQRETIKARDAEIERLRREISEELHPRAEAFEAVVAENERLRAALEAISDLHVDEAGRCFDIADHALNPPA